MGYEKVVIDWNKKFKNFPIDTKSFFKNLIRFNSKKELAAYGEYNKQVEQTKQKAITITANLNSAMKESVETLGFVNGFYEQMLGRAESHVERTGSLQQKIQGLRTTFKNAKLNLSRKSSKIPSYAYISEAYGSGSSKNDISSDLKSFNSAISPLYTQIVAVTSKIQKNDSEISGIKTKISNCSSEVSMLKNVISDNERKITCSGCGESGYREKIASYESSIRSKQSSIQSLRTEKNFPNTPPQRKGEIERRIGTYLREIKDLEQQISKYRSSITKCETEISNARSRIDSLNLEIKNLNVDSNGKQLQGGELRRQKSELQSDLDTVKRNIEKFNMQVYNNFYSAAKTNLLGQVSEIEQLISKLKFKRKQNVKNPAAQYCVSAKTDIINILKKFTEDSKKLTSSALTNQSESINSELQKVKSDKTYADGVFKGFFSRFSTKKKQLGNINITLDTTQTNIDKSNAVLVKIRGDVGKFEMPPELTEVAETTISSEITKELQDIDIIQQKVAKLECDTNDLFSNSNQVAFVKMNFDSFLKSVTTGRLSR